MPDTLIVNVLSLLPFVVSLLIALRIFYLCFQTTESNHRLFILALSMGIFSLTAMASYTADSIPDLLINVDWFKYIGQDVCFFFILLSLITQRERDLRSLIRWELLFFVLLLILMTPLMPQSFPYPFATKVVLDGLRFLFCLLIFFFYLAAFIRKETRFSILMGSAFGLMSLGYLLNMPKYMDTQFVLLDMVGNAVHLCGILFLLMAVFLS